MGDQAGCETQNSVIIFKSLMKASRESSPWGSLRQLAIPFLSVLTWRDQEEPIAIPVNLSIVSNALEKWFKGLRDCFGSWCANSVVLCWLLVCSILGLQLDKTSLWQVYVTEELTSWWPGKGGWAGHTLSVLCPLICLRFSHFPVVHQVMNPQWISTHTIPSPLNDRSTRQGPRLNT